MKFQSKDVEAVVTPFRQITFWQSLGFGELTGAKDPLSQRVTRLFPSPAEGVNADNNSYELSIFSFKWLWERQHERLQNARFSNCTL